MNTSRAGVKGRRGRGLNEELDGIANERIDAKSRATTTVRACVEMLPSRYLRRITRHRFNVRSIEILI